MTLINCMTDNQLKNTWKFLLNEKNETILLFPFWRDFEWSYQNLYRFTSSLAVCDELTLRQMILNNLKIPLIRLVKKVLVYEFHLIQKNNLRLTLPEFLENLAEKSELQQFLDRYQILKGHIEKIFKHHNHYIMELLTRLQTDLKELEELFNLENYEWNLIKCLGDSHCLGKQVSIITFCQDQEVKQIVYKPRDMNLEKMFHIFLEFINKNCLSKPIKTIKILSKNGYGWAEYVEHLNIQKIGADDYYFKFGVLLGICHLLNGRDIHFENIIASGEDPVIIDLECLFTPPVRQQQYNDLDFPSIFATLLIPPIHDHAKKQDDFSAAQNHAIQPFMINQYVIKGDFQRIVYLEKIAVFIKPEKNILVDQSTQDSISASTYSRIIAQGYCHYMRWVIKNREEVLAFVIGHFSHLETRLVFRPTFMYQRVLLESFHPKFLIDFQQYYHSLNQLLDKGHALSKAIDYHEFFDLLNGDIPYFSTSTSDTFIRNSQGEIIKLKTKCSGLERVVNKISCLDDEYINKRIEQILISLDSTNETDYKNNLKRGLSSC